MVGNAGDDVNTVGFIGLGDQGLPMASAVAEAGYELHVWARREASMDALGDVAHIRHPSAADLASLCDIVALCVATDDDVLRIVSDELRDAMRSGSVVVNHGTGIPRNAILLARRCGERGIDSLDAPVSGGRPGAEARTLTTLVGGPEPVVARCEPIFRSFASHVKRVGDAGAGQMAKLFNNALLAMNQASIADIVSLGIKAGLDPVDVVEALKLGSATSAALTLLNTMVTPETVDHLAKVQDLDIDLFAQALEDADVSAQDIVARSHSGPRRLPELVGQLNP
jgi:3-hydroxyisobutyrate dehydrogenase-like beta-hydroxyacid dehydrogenase